MTGKAAKVFVVQGRGRSDFSDTQSAVAHVPAQVTVLPFIGVVNPEVYAPGAVRRAR